MSTKKVKSVIPIYAVGAAMLFYCLLFPLYSIWHFVILLCFAALSYFVALKLFPGKHVEAPATDFSKTGDRSVNAALTGGKAFIENLYIYRKEIANPEMRKHVAEIISDSEKIFDFISKAPESFKLIRSFYDYYLPQTEKILSAYIEMKKVDSSGKSILDTIKKIEDSMPSIATAFDTQLDNLYGEKAFDIRTDLKVLEGILKSDGLGGK